jgi:hypothetical protein
MLKGALLYGGLVYMLNGNFMPKKQPFQFEEQRVDF